MVLVTHLACMTRYNMHVVKGCCILRDVSLLPCICIIPGCTTLSGPLAEAVQHVIDP